MRIAFYAPLKPPDHETPSGDRRVARLLIDALRLAGHEPVLASHLRSFDPIGRPFRQKRLAAHGRQAADRLIARWRARPEAAPGLWFTYHLYYKAPDWLGPAVSEALGIPYVIAEASHAPKRAQGPWAYGHEAAAAAIRKAALVFAPSRDDIAGLEALVDARRIVHLPPFLDAAPYAAATRERERLRAELAAAHALDSAVPWLAVVAMMRAGDKLASYRALAAALQRLAGSRWQLLVAGDGPMRAGVEALFGERALSRRARPAAHRRDARRLRSLPVAGGERSLRHGAPRSAGSGRSGRVLRHARRARRRRRRPHRRARALRR
jgi:hypothetical protein